MLPPRQISVSEWADENRSLTGGAAAERGSWRTRPYQREPMDTLGPDDPAQEIVIMSAAQMLKSECLLNFLGYIADVDPGPVLFVEPSIETARALSMDRVAPMFRVTPCLRGKIADVKSRDSGNTILHKALANGAGHLTFVGANSPSGLAMRPIRYVLLDEVDRYPDSAGEEGDPVTLAKQRTAEFSSNKKVVLCSTPTVKGASRIERAWLESDQREYYVPCPMCDHYQVLKFGDGVGAGVVWQEGKPEAAGYRCEHCAQIIPHHLKATMVGRGEYRARNPLSNIPGFRVTQLLSPKKSWGDLVVEFLAAKKSPETLKAFINTVLCELWEDKHDTPTGADALAARCEPYPAEVPAGAVLLTAGVDVQADRLEVEIVGWGKDEESWSIAQHVIPGDTERNEVWEQLDCVLTSEYLHESNTPMRIACACIDTGFRDATVLKFTRTRFNRRVYAIKGRAGESAIWAHKPSRKQNTPFFMVGVDGAKTATYDRLKIDAPGAGYCHFPLGRPVEYFEQLTAERQDTRYHHGFPKREWRKETGARNEALDCRVYAYAALHALYAGGLKLAALAERFARMIERRPAAVVAAPAAPAAPDYAAIRAREEKERDAAQGNDPRMSGAQASLDAQAAAMPRSVQRQAQREGGWVPQRNWFSR